jgi:hypothetical protein
MVVGTRPYGGKKLRSARGATEVLACGPTKKPGKVRRPAKHASPEKRLYAGKATTSIGLASSLDRNYRRCVACERRVQDLQDPGHRGVLREGIDGERAELQKELDLVRMHSSISLKRSREIESVFKRWAFALVDASDALGKSKRDASISLLSAFAQKERATISSVEAVEAE